MPLGISLSKRPLPVGKCSSLRNKSYEVEPAPGRQVYLSDDIPVLLKLLKSSAAYYTKNRKYKKILRKKQMSDSRILTKIKL
jgi:hypothetical protein